MFGRWLAAVLAMLAASAASAQTTTDPAFCRVLHSFVTSVRPGEVKEIVFRTAWGRGFNDSPEQLFEKRCHHPDDEPSVRLCGYLVKHGSTEFTGVTVKSALMCFSPQTRLAPDLRLQQGVFSFNVGPPDRGAWVDASFGDDPDVGGKAFRLKAKGY
ncbi:hypothetical protein [Roseateles asaccharophilus]|uniref:Uncharacterized protein n=1 Tax=Roseateles asaccharophilus TaxID=582607 RepID=A0ABU2AFE1_9BURK|nr:hypothetical protein [Roseateles asaccharophilus]MDR7335800.1 hypothetical protein [Roseateles asaccharophilus]